MEQGDRERPIVYPTPPKPPETPKDESLKEKSMAASRASSFRYYQTHIRLYVQETGTELGLFGGNTCEIRGNITADGETTNVRKDLHEKTHFESENGGLGRIVCDVTKRTISAPADFSGTLYEEGGFGVGDRYFTRASVDWDTAPTAWANGNSWWFTQWVSNDQNFIGHLWWQVSEV
jgi:hypothetical protein